MFTRSNAFATASLPKTVQWKIMEKYQHKYRIPSARLKTWDYRWTGVYFITVCTHVHPQRHHHKNHNPRGYQIKKSIWSAIKKFGIHYSGFQNWRNHQRPKNPCRFCMANPVSRPHHQRRKIVYKNTILYKRKPYKMGWWQILQYGVTGWMGIMWWAVWMGIMWCMRWTGIMRCRRNGTDNTDCVGVTRWL